MLRFGASPWLSRVPSTALSIPDGARDALLGRPIAAPRATTEMEGTIESANREEGNHSTLHELRFVVAEVVTFLVPRVGAARRLGPSNSLAMQR